MASIIVCALYKFTPLQDIALLQQSLLKLMNTEEIKGTLLLAPEGINGTVAGHRQAIDTLLHFLNQDVRFNPISYKESYTDTVPFLRSRVKLKKEIVTMGIDNIDPTHRVGTYVNAQQWNELVQDPEVTLIDTRNDYEYQVGTFKGAINPETKSFREFPKYVEQHLSPQKNKKVAMFCTGGIRCEKSTAYLKQQGFEEVYHLKGGILQYLQEVDPSQSLWQGECFVFDERVTVNGQLEKGSYDQCNACRMPITEADKAAATYQQGISCPHCYHTTSPEQKKRFAEREKQMQLAQQRGQCHIGDTANHYSDINRHKKRALMTNARDSSLKK